MREICDEYRERLTRSETSMSNLIVISYEYSSMIYNWRRLENDILLNYVVYGGVCNYDKMIPKVGKLPKNYIYSKGGQ